MSIEEVKERVKKGVSVPEVVRRLGLETKGRYGTYVRCFNRSSHKNGDKNYSMRLYLDTNSFYCFGCGVGGDVIDLWREANRVEFLDALNELASWINVSIDTKGVKIKKETQKKAEVKKEVRRDFSAVYEAFLNAEGVGVSDEMLKFCEERGIREESIEMHNLCCVIDREKVVRSLKEKFERELLEASGVLGTTEGWMVVPYIKDGRVVDLQLRTLRGEEPKYKNLKGSKILPFNIDEVRNLNKGEDLYICEGAIDTILMMQMGKSAVGIRSATADKDLEEYLSRLIEYNIILAIDNDEAGNKAVEKIAEMFQQRGKPVKRLCLPEGKDIGDCVVEDIDVLKLDIKDIEARDTENTEGGKEERELPKTIAEYFHEYIKHLREDGELMGFKSGFIKLDEVLSGLSGLIVFGGDPGRGKTSFILQIAYNVAESGKPVLFYTLEMDEVSILTKILNRLSGIGYVQILTKGKAFLESKSKVFQEACEKLQKVGEKFFLRSFRDGEINFEKVEKEIEAIQKRYGKEILVVVDHMQVFPVDGADRIDRETNVITNFREIKSKTGACIILISQKNKMGIRETKPKQGANGRQKGKEKEESVRVSDPGLESIKGSVDIVYQADVVAFLEAGVAETAKYAVGEENAVPQRLIVYKNRYGRTGDIWFVFDKVRGSFEEASNGEEAKQRAEDIDKNGGVNGEDVPF